MSGIRHDFAGGCPVPNSVVPVNGDDLAETSSLPRMSTETLYVAPLRVV